MKGRLKRTPLRGRPTLAHYFIKRGRIPRRCFGVGIVGGKILDESGSPIRDEQGNIIYQD